MSNLKYRVDIVLCFDLSSNNLLQFLKKGFVKLTDDLKNDFLAKEKFVEVLRVKFIGFDDNVENLQESPFFILPGMEDELDSFFSKVQLKKDNIQNSVLGLTAIELAIKSNWTKRGDRNKHIIFMYSINTSKEFQKMNVLTDLWESNQYINNRFKRLVVFAPESNAWTDIATHWDNTVHYPSRAGEGLAEVDYQTILSAIVNSI